MGKITKRIGGLLSLILLLLVADQWTKYLAVNYLKVAQPINIFPGFNLTLVFNKGMAFGMGSDFSTGVLSLAVTICAFLLLWIMREIAQNFKIACLLSCILAGAIGNISDRFFHGHVIDFLDIYIGKWHWPAFNIADIAICFGAFLLMIMSFYSQTEDEDKL